MWAWRAGCSRERRPLLATHHLCCKTNSGQEWNVGMMVGQGVFEARSPYQGYMCVVRLFSGINVLCGVVCVGGVFIQVTCVNREWGVPVPCHLPGQGSSRMMASAASREAAS